ncbi:diacylglycerol kinase family protein [Phocaeicola sp.]|uniref:diacylglycerol/lipid kinase family protein n=1 Tax=Phocaeicola sp. TaxID=2773926 RepID=UPI0030770C49
MDSKKEIVFIINPISGTHSKEFILHQVEKRLNHTLYDYTIRKTEYAGHATEIARQAAEDKKDIVVAIGGDGTINEVGRALIHTDTAMGIIPCGSGNGLARHLHIPLEARGAIEVLNQGFIKTIDYGLIDSHPFFCTCGVGFDAFVSLKFADSGKRGLLTYLENTLHESLTYRPETYEIENATGTVRYKAFLIACANASQYGNNAYIAPQASLTDGMMDVTILEPFTVLDVPALSFQLFNKTIDQNSRIKTLKEKKITIHRTQEGVFHFDGDPAMGGKDLEVEIISKGLNVIAPQRGKSTIEAFNILQHFTDFIGSRPITSTIARKHKELLQINHNLLRRLSKRD